MCSVDVPEVGGGPVQSGDSVRIGVTEGHQRVQLITVETDPPPATKDNLSFTRTCVCVCVTRDLHTIICSPALPLQQIVPLLPRATSYARLSEAVWSGFSSHGGLRAAVASLASGSSSRLRHLVCEKNRHRLRHREYNSFLLPSVVLCCPPDELLPFK